MRVNPPVERDFWSHRRLGRVLRDPSPRSLDQWAGVSVYASVDDAVNLVHEFPRLGHWIAEIRLDDAPGVRIEWTSGMRASHHTIWAAPDVLLAAVVAVRGVPRR